MSEHDPKYALDPAQVRRSFDRAAKDYDAHAPLQREVRERLLEKLDIAAVVEEQLQVLGIQAENSKSAAHLSGLGVVGGGPCPSRVQSLMHELQKAAVLEIHRGLVELGVHDVSRGAFSSEVR